MWLEEGMKDLSADELVIIFKETQSSSLEGSIKNLNDGQLSINSENESVTCEGRKGKFITYFVPDDEPRKMIRFENTESITLNSPASLSRSVTPSQTQIGQENIKFNEICSKRLDEIQLQTVF